MDPWGFGNNVERRYKLTAVEDPKLLKKTGLRFIVRSLYPVRNKITHPILNDNHRITFKHIDFHGPIDAPDNSRRRVCHKRNSTRPQTCM